VDLMSVFDRLLTAMPFRTPDSAQPTPETPEYISAREEAADIARRLGLDISNEHWDQASIGDFLRLCYAQGWKACERKVMSPDTADAIAFAIERPEKIVTEPGYISGTGRLRWQVQAVQRAAVYGVPK
jgi:hypothetical protein